MRPIRAFVVAALITGAASAHSEPFHLEEATIASIQTALLNKEITTEQLVRLYLKRIKAYNGTCVEQPDGILGPIKTIPHAGRINALQTLNLRPAARAECSNGVVSDFGDDTGIDRGSAARQLCR